MTSMREAFRLVTALSILLAGTQSAWAGQTPPATPATQVAPAAQKPAGARLRVFLDCDCFQDYLRDEIKFVDFVHQAQDADVHILSTTSDTGGGGRETVLRLIGRGRFTGHDQELKAISQSAEAESTRRERIKRTVEVGLAAYLAREGLPANLGIEVGGERDEARRPADDPWKSWVFSIRGSADFNIEETQRDRSWDINAGADRITEAWKITIGTGFSKEIEEFDLDEDEPLKAVRHERRGSWFIAKSWGPHWSVGLDGEVESSTFGNTKFAWNTAPAIEYSVFPYSEYARRQLRLMYAAGVAHARYNEITLFDKFEETHPVHKAEMAFERQEPWGSIDTRFEFSQYLHDLSKYRLEVSGELSWRITRGLSVNLDGGVSRVRDQLSLPRRDATQEEVLLRLRELQSAYEISFDIGFTYSFGALYNNIVNPRFGR
jgi:hypothetical protein